MLAGMLQYHSAEWLLPIDTPPVYDGFIAVENGKITAIGQRGDLPESARPAPPKRGTIMSPGLINAHVHLEQSYPETIEKKPDDSFADWLWKVIRLNTAHGSAAEKLARSRAGVEMLLSTGTTCVSDISSGPESMQALGEAGLRGVVAIEYFHPPHAPIEIKATVASWTAFETASRNYPNLQAGISPHTPYTVSPSAWQAVVDTCQPRWIHTHLAETRMECDYLAGRPSAIPELFQQITGENFQVDRPATSPTRYLADFGLLTENTLAAHGVFTDAEDRRLLAEAGIGVAHCPRSNLLLHGETLAYRDWADYPAPVALGTDGRLSTPDLDLRAEARCAMEVHGLSAAEILPLITLNGARMLRLDGQIGSLTSGKWADWVLWQGRENDSRPPEARLLDSDTRVSHVLIDGESRWTSFIACSG